MGQSLAQQVAALPEAERDAALEGIDPEELLYDWAFWSRSEQQEPPDDWWTIWSIVAGRGVGKPLDADTPIPTPSGWIRIGDLKPGDTIYAHDGRPTRVTNVYNPGTRESLLVTFHDGAKLVAGKTHEWVVLDTKDKSVYRIEHDPRIFNPQWWSWSPRVKTRGPGVVVPRNEILEHGRILRDAGSSWREIEAILRSDYPDARPQETSRHRLKTILEDGKMPTGTAYARVRGARVVTTDTLSPGRHSIFATAPLECADASLSIDPYVLGMWLGDGSTRDGDLCAHIDDAPHFAAEMKARGYDDVATRVDTRNPNLVCYSSAVLRAQLKAERLLGDKHVPTPYLRSSFSQRLDLLRGLMDTDGTCSADSSGCGVGFINESLANAAHELAVSLGYLVFRRVRTLPATDIRPTRPFFIVHFRPRPEVNPFLLRRKAERVQPLPLDQAWRKVSRLVASVTPVEDRDLVCISVDAPSRLFLAGKDMVPTHNTRSGSEWVRDKARVPNTRIALVARTAADARDVMIEGESGIMNIHPPSEQPRYSPANRRITWPNGSLATSFSADVPDQLRGPQFGFAWCDEMAAWPFIPGLDGATAWDNVQIATRLGTKPRLLVTTTPKRLPAMQDLLKREGRDVVVTRGSTLENAGNLGEAYLNFIFGLYAGTRMEQQELYGIMLDDVEGALWNDALISRSRFLGGVPIGLPLKVIAVDPSVAENPKDECGIIVAGATGGKRVAGRHAYVLADESVHGSPDVWAQRVVQVWDRWRCPVVAEVNQGGALVSRMIHALNPEIPVIEVRATQGKAVRAEPVLLKYDQNRVHHVGYLGELESQLCSWVPGETKKSPDRLDALVYAVIALIVDPPKSFGGGGLRAKSPGGGQLPGAFRRRR